MIRLKAMEYRSIDHKDKDLLEAIDSHMTLIHSLLEQLGYRPFGQLDLVFPGDTDKKTFEWRGHGR